MNDYSQPDFYRFNQDSLKLVEWVLKKNLLPKNILDLGAGSGVLGLELAKQLKPQSVTLVEVQKEYLEHMTANCEEFLPAEVAHQVKIESFSEFHSRELFDLIVCNPPYYIPENGELSSNPNRAIARSFLVDSWEILIGKIQTSLAPAGKCFIVLKTNTNLNPIVQTNAEKFSLGFHLNPVDNLTFVELFRLDKN